MKENLTIAVIIPTYNGAGKILSLLDALSRQTLQDFEVIIVIDGSTDNTEKVLEGYYAKFRCLKVIKQANSGRSVVRNRGVKETKSDVLIFYDDDMMPCEKSVQKHLQFHSFNYGLLSGDQRELTDKHNSDIQNYKAWLSENWTNKYVEGVTRMSADNLFFTAANCSFPRKLFLQLGGFDERLTDAEDYDLGYRALEQGIPVCFDKENKAIHNDRLTCSSYVSRLRAYSAAKKKLMTLHPDRARSIKRSPAGFFKSMFYKIFAFPFWVRLIDSGLFVFLLPKKIRYRLYSIIIQALAVKYATTPI